MDDMIKVGEKAENFVLKDQYREDVALKSFLGRKVLLSWHPLAWTSVCTDQMRSLDRNFKRFEESNTIVLGLSVDPLPSKSVWSKALALKNLRILSDFNPLGKVAKDYGLFSERYGASKRGNILIDEEGNVIWTKKYEIHTLPDIEEIFNYIESLY